MQSQPILFPQYDIFQVKRDIQWEKKYEYAFILPIERIEWMLKSYATLKLCRKVKSYSFD